MQVADGFAAAEAVDLEQHRDADHVAAEALDELAAGGEGAARREHVVDEQHARSRGQVVVHLDGGGAVLEGVVDGCRGAGQLARLADRDESGARGDGGGTREDEPAGVEPRDDVELPGERFDDRLGGDAQRLGVGEQGRDVAEDDARLRVVRHVADQRLGADEGRGEFGFGH